MKTTKYYLAIATALFVSGFISCDKLDGDMHTGAQISEESGKSVNVRVAVKVASERNADGTEIPESKAPLTVKENDYENFWIFQFNGSGDDAVMVTPPYYVDNAAVAASKLPGGDPGYAPMELPLIESLGSEHRVVFIANTNKPKMEWNLRRLVNTYADLKAKVLNVTSEGISYSATSENLIMSGTVVTKIDPAIVIDGDSDYSTAVGPGVELVRSVARVELNVSVDAAKAAGYKVTGVRMRNVSTTLTYLDDQATFPAIYPKTPTLVDYAPLSDKNGLVTAGGNGKFVWYVPRNTRGVTVGSASAKTKNANALVWSTYFEIHAVDASGKGVAYRVYPGANNVDDFNIIPNHNYYCSLNIVGDGAGVQDESRVASYGDVIFDGANNSFILNPPLEGMPARKFSIPVTRVNEFWEPTLTGFGGMNSKPMGVDAVSGATWKIDLLWQDDKDIFRPVATADPDKNITFLRDNGKGPTYNIELSVPSGVPHGNAVIILRNKDEDTGEGVGNIWWSWHLWVTDYDPDVNKVTLRTDKWVFPVPGGQLERYGGITWGYPNSASDDYTYAPTAASHYKDKYMMDRTLGRKSARDIIPHTVAGSGLAYQWGRKDPFPASISIYDINGMAITSTPAADMPQQVWNASNTNCVIAPVISANSNMNIILATRNPLMFLGGEANPWSGLTTTRLWNDVRYVSASYTGKSIFDPCPPGWHVPNSSALTDDFRYNVTISSSARDLIGISATNIYYWPNIKVGDEYPAERTIYYTPPFTRRATEGALFNDGSYWTSQWVNATGARRMYINGSMVANTTSQNHGFGVRCVSM